MTTPEKRKFRREDALPIAEWLVNELRPFCELITIAGSIRREKAMVGDIEILAVPRMEPRKVDMFAEERFDSASEELDRLLARSAIVKRPNINGQFAWGARNKLAVHCGSQIPVDFFFVEARCWFVALVIRTGGKETNLELTTGALARGRRLHAYGGLEDRDGSIAFPDSEEAVFQFSDVPYKQPKDRK